MPVSAPCLVHLQFYGKPIRFYGVWFTIFSHGHGGNGFLPTVGKIMLQSGGSFGLFMGIGGLVRCDDEAYKQIEPEK